MRINAAQKINPQIDQSITIFPVLITPPKNMCNPVKLILLLIISTFFLCSEIYQCRAAAQKNISAATPTGRCDTTTYKFTSCLDGDQDFYSLRQGKSDKNAGILLVYFHGLSGDFKELKKSGLADTIDKSFPGLSMLSCNYGRSPSWGIAISRVDVSNNIRDVLNKTNSNRIVLVGTSMGGSAALTYAATAPSYIKKRILGVVAVAPCAELGDLYQKTSATVVKSSMEAALGGSASDKPSIYHQNSLDACLAFLPEKIKVAIITAQSDTAIPAEVQLDVVRDLNNRNLNVKSFELEDKSEPPPIDSILEGLRFILQ
jgi:pimeloyl-ACP methyl ester carboxylesterase